MIYLQRFVFMLCCFGFWTFWNMCSITVDFGFNRSLCQNLNIQIKMVMQLTVKVIYHVNEYLISCYVDKWVSSADFQQSKSKAFFTCTNIHKCKMQHVFFFLLLNRYNFYTQNYHFFSKYCHYLLTIISVPCAVIHSFFLSFFQWDKEDIFEKMLYSCQAPKIIKKYHKKVS